MAALSKQIGHGITLGGPGMGSSMTFLVYANYQVFLKWNRL